jgi:hypothetical protein
VSTTAGGGGARREGKVAGGGCSRYFHLADRADLFFFYPKRKTQPSNGVIIKNDRRTFSTDFFAPFTNGTFSSLI